MEIDLEESFHNTEKKGKIANDVVPAVVPAAVVPAAVVPAAVVAAVVAADNKTAAADENVADNQNCVSVRCPVFDRQLNGAKGKRCESQSLGKETNVFRRIFSSIDFV